MHLSEVDLQQCDEAKLSALTAAQKDALLVKGWQDLKEARERLRQDSQTRSRPPSSDPPGSRVGPAQADGEEGLGSEADPPAAGPSEAESMPLRSADEAEATAQAPCFGTPCLDTSAAPRDPGAEPKRPGRPRGAAGQRRHVKLPVRGPGVHRPAPWVLGGRGLERARWVARTGLYVLEVVSTEAEGLQGLQVNPEKHL